ncbi:MAG: tetratricopeptide repeat protein, partial [Planctomycetes bacterium]|nr:tetratricopeptide repeat protein [Planctomycetota bacterium]
MRFEESDQATAKALELDPALAESYNIRGISHYQRQLYDEALRLFEGYIAALPTLEKERIATGHSNRGNVLSCLNRVQEAIEAYKTAIASAPRSPRTYNTRIFLSDLYAGQSQFNEATEALNGLLALAPNYADAWYKRGVVRIQMGNPEGALEDFKTAVSTPRQFSQGLEASAYQDIQAEWYILEDVIENKSVLSKEPEDGDAFAMRALARIYYSKVDNRIAEIEKARKDLEQADSMLKGKTDQEATTFRIYYASNTIVVFQAGSGEFDKALKTKRLALRYPPSPEARFGMIFEAIQLVLGGYQSSTSDADKKKYIDQCFEFLNLAHELGFKNWQGLAELPAYQPLHSDPRWAEFLEKIK